MTMTISHSTEQMANTYTTKGLGLAAYLWSLGYELLETRWKGDLCMWIFPSTDELSEKVKEFLAGQARIDPQMYYKKLVEFRRQMWDTKPKEDNPNNSPNVELTDIS